MDAAWKFCLVLVAFIAGAGALYSLGQGGDRADDEVSGAVTIFLALFSTPALLALLLIWNQG